MSGARSALNSLVALASPSGYTRSVASFTADHLHHGRIRLCELDAKSCPRRAAEAPARETDRRAWPGAHDLVVDDGTVADAFVDDDRVIADCFRHFGAKVMRVDRTGSPSVHGLLRE